MTEVRFLGPATPTASIKLSGIKSGPGIHDREGFTTENRIKVFGIMKKFRGNAVRPPAGSEFS